MIHGIINIYKEKGFTSHDVVAKARGILRQKKIGHTGTLDPDAVGVLPICLGKGTKVVPFLTDEDKQYEAEVILGATTTTEDATGSILEVNEVHVTEERVREVVESFIGDYTQIPPMYSAIKVNGIRLYELARKGIEIDRPSRQVYIHACEIIENLSENRFKIRVTCSKGTYIRTLCTDIGKKLGCGAHMGELIRTFVGPYKIQDSITLSQLEGIKEDVSGVLYSIESLFMQYPIGIVKTEYMKALNNGNPLPVEAVSCKGVIETKVRIYDDQEQFVGVYYLDQEKQRLSVDKIFIEK